MLGKSFLSILLVLTLQDQIHIAQNIYFEARGESQEGWKVVMATTLNRVESDKFPNSVYEVIWQENQFSWTHDGKSDVPKDKKKWHEIVSFVKKQSVHDLLMYGITHYHRDDVSPKWSNELQFLGKVGRHLTYREVTK